MISEVVRSTTEATHGYYYGSGTTKYENGTRIYLCELHPTKKEPNRKKLVILVRKFTRAYQNDKPPADYEGDIRQIVLDEGMVDSLLDALILAQSYLRGDVKDLV
jgi:hypothetical protein